IAIAPAVLAADLDANWEVLGEAIQTVIRAEVTAGRSSIADPYALLKGLTRGKRITADELRAFVEGLDIGDEARQRLLALTPATCTGLGGDLVDYLPWASPWSPGRSGRGAPRCGSPRCGEIASSSIANTTSATMKATPAKTAASTRS